MPVNKKISFSIWYVFLAIFAVILVHDFIVAMQKLEELPYSEFRTLVAAGKVAEVTVTHQTLTGKLKPEEGSKEQKLFTTVRVEDPDLVKELNARNVKFTGVIESTFLTGSHVLDHSCADLRRHLVVHHSGASVRAKAGS